MAVDFKSMTKKEAISYCYKHKKEFIASFEGDYDPEQFDCLITLLESGTITPAELPDYGMDFE